MTLGVIRLIWVRGCGCGSSMRTVCVDIVSIYLAFFNVNFNDFNISRASSTSYSKLFFRLTNLRIYLRSQKRKKSPLFPKHNSHSVRRAFGVFLTREPLLRFHSCRSPPFTHLNAVLATNICVQRNSLKLNNVDSKYCVNGFFSL